jgi:hypothetical protein
MSPENEIKSQNNPQTLNPQQIPASFKGSPELAVPKPKASLASRFGKVFFVLAVLAVLAGVFAYKYRQSQVRVNHGPQTLPVQATPKSLTILLSKDKISDLQTLDAQAADLGFVKITSLTPLDASKLTEEQQTFILSDFKSLKAEQSVYGNGKQGVYLSYILSGQVPDQVTQKFKDLLGSKVISIKSNATGRLIEAKNKNWNAKILYFSNNQTDTIISVEIISF